MPVHVHTRGVPGHFERRNDDHERIDAINLTDQTVGICADRNSIRSGDRPAGGVRPGEPENLAIDHDGHIYIIEDRNGGWTTTLVRPTIIRDGDLTAPARALGAGRQWHHRIGVRPLLDRRTSAGDGSTASRRLAKRPHIEITIPASATSADQDLIDSDLMDPAESH